MPTPLKPALPPGYFPTEAESQQLIHEMGRYQVELELQNHALLELRSQLERSLERYAELYDFAPVGHFTLTGDSAIRELNLAGAALLGQEQSRLVAQRFGPFVSEQTRPDFSAFLDRVLAGTTREHCDVALAREGMPICHLRLEGVGVQDSGEWLGRIAAMDITARKRMEEKLHRSEMKYRKLHESLRDAFVSVDMAGRILEFNQIYQAMLGYSAEELLTLTYLEVTPARWHDAEAQIVREQILKRGYSDVYEKEYRRKDGTVFPVELRTVLISDASGQPESMWAIVRDITDRKAAELALQATLEEKTVLMKEIHHRVKNNLFVLSSLLGLQADRTFVPEAAAVFRDMQGRIQSMGLLHETLCRSDNLARIGLPDYLENVCAWVWDAVGPETRRIVLKRQIEGKTRNGI